MFFTEYLVAGIAILFKIAFAIVSSIVFCPAWNCVATNYLCDWLPEKFQCVPYWHFVAIILTCSFLGEQIAKLCPTIISISNEKTVKENK